MTTNRIPFFAFPSLLLLATVASAQTITSTVGKSATHLYGVGDAEVGAQAQFDAGMSMTTTRQFLSRYAPPHVALGADVAAVGRVLFRGASYDVGGANASAAASGGSTGSTGTSASGSWSAGAQVRILDKTVLVRSYSGYQSTDFALWSMQHTATLFDVSVSYPLVLGVSANVGFRASASINGGINLAVDPITVGLGLGSSFGAGASGTVSVSFSLACVEGGISGTLRLLNGSVAPNMAANYANGIQGGFDYRFEAMKVIASVFVNGCGWVSYSKDIYERVFGLLEGTKAMQ